MAVATDKSRVTIYIPDHLKQYLEAWAKEDGRSVSNLVERLLTQAVKEKEGAK
ncbi:MAG: hypothetical protein N4J56_002496 [Chroococcidiopsis sp. SAG 2025]|uniref:CopG-like ribbon-helix-helix domain-containing protein n=1 Tax=Chroococcidiopsis thermalis (strain PCC 7203) TaxID=251229 RepID=K9TVU5_CHRTP|nr:MULTISPECIES: ribbon-helix-helix protein, CopG family [Chroococcidiopsis]AFY86690.1 hypothetical protein Chro_1162 [Chroococcidiopsis thermalis PCC 7203]MDV2992842.1 hypothetical protein [Chroococcidiopsis sp. SAG 2025]